MKIVFVRKVSQKVLDARYRQDVEGKVIDYILLTEEEAKSLCAEKILPEFAEWGHVHGCSLF